MMDWIIDHFHWVLGAILACIVSVIVACVYHNETVEMPKAYQAWVKQTGNPKELSYDEWRSLLEAAKRSDDTTIIFIPH